MTPESFLGVVILKEHQFCSPDGLSGQKRSMSVAVSPGVLRVMLWLLQSCTMQKGSNIKMMVGSVVVFGGKFAYLFTCFAKSEIQNEVLDVKYESTADSQFPKITKFSLPARMELFK